MPGVPKFDVLLVKTSRLLVPINLGLNNGVVIAQAPNPEFALRKPVTFPYFAVSFVWTKNEYDDSELLLLIP